MMRNYVNEQLFFQIYEASKNINFETQCYMATSFMGHRFPVSIHEIIEALPKSIKGKKHDYALKMEWYPREKKWAVDYSEYLKGLIEPECLKGVIEPELVDALGKLLIWAIQEGWVKK